MNNLKIGSLIVPVEALLEFEQNYEDLQGQDFKRTAAGGGILRLTWSGKLRTLVTARGWAPPPLFDLDIGSTHTIGCAVPDSASSATTTVTLPAARRTDADHQPIGFADTGDRLVLTTITNAAAINAKSTNDATLVAVSGAIAYRVHYWPEIVAAITERPRRGDSKASFRWSLVAEEI